MSTEDPDDIDILWTQWEADNIDKIRAAVDKARKGRVTKVQNIEVKGDLL